MYFLLGASIKLAFLLFANVFAALVATFIWRLISARLEGLSPHTRAQLIFALRVGPVFAAFVFVFGFVVPAYILHEPENSGETVTLKLAVVAGLSLAALAITAVRILRTWFATRRLENAWSATAVPICFRGAKVPVFQIESSFPVIAVVGIFRPRIYIASHALKSLSSAELDAAIAHEEGHISSNDNLKRAILRIARDLLLLPIGRRLDKAWARNVEAAADEFATGRSHANALELASAIVKLARIAPSSANATSGALLIGRDGSDVDDRVRRLISLADGTIPITARRFSSIAPAWVWPFAAAALCFLHIADPSLLLTTHEAIERFVSLTQ